jgi:hypothetical protein
MPSESATSGTICSFFVILILANFLGCGCC